MAYPPPALPSALTSATSPQATVHQTREAATCTYPPATTPASTPAVDSGDKMAPRNSQRGSRLTPIPRREPDLSALLIAGQKNELMLLVTSITDTMQQQVCQVFDQPVSPPMANMQMNVVNRTTSETSIWKSTGPDAVTTNNLKASEKNKENQNQQPIDIQVNMDDRGEKMEGVQVELKKEAIAAFKKWQALVIKRLSEIIAAKEPTPHNGKFQDGKPSRRSSGRGPGRSPGKSGLGGRGNTTDNKSAIGATQTASFITAARSLLQFSSEKRQLLMHAMLLLLLSLESYPAYSRVLLHRMASHFRVPLRLVSDDELRVAQSLSCAADNAFPEDGLFKRPEEPKRGKRGRAGVTSSSSNVAPGLAVPLKAAQIGFIVGGPGLGSAAAATALGTMGTLADGGLATCIFFGLCGPRGSPSKSLDAYTKDIQDIALWPLHGEQIDVREGRAVPHRNRRLRLTIGIDGWLSRNEDARSPWHVLGDKSEAYVLGWEYETLSKIGTSLDTVATSMAWQNAKKEFVSRNGKWPILSFSCPPPTLTPVVFASLRAFKWPGSLLKISKIIDNPWSVGMVRADKVGIALADAILNKVQGERGVSLLGYGLGARVIYTCLMSLSERRVFGSVENVIMMGTPAPSASCVWTALRSVVTDRIINVFSENDCMLGFLHRTSCIQFGVAGLQRIEGVYGIENVDATKPVTSHLRYAELVGRILKDVGWEDLDMDEVKSEEAFLSVTKVTEEGPKKKGGRSGEGKKRSARKRMESMEAQFQELNITH